MVCRTIMHNKYTTFYFCSYIQVIGTEKAVGASNINMNNLEYSLSMFKAMKYLEVGGYTYYTINHKSEILE